MKSWYAFGSVLTEKFNKNSDVDLIVDFEQIDVIDYSYNYFELKFSLDDKLNRKINLLAQKTLKNPYFIKNLEQTKKLIYR